MVAGRLLRGHHILVKGGIYVKKNKKMIVGFLAPAVIIFLIVFLYPIIRTIMMSMYKIESVTDTMEWWTFVGLGNYQKLFTTAIFKTAMMNILKIWALGGIIVLSVLAGIGVPVIRSNPDKWNTREEIFPCNHLSSEYCKCGSACNHVAAVCIQF